MGQCYCVSITNFRIKQGCSFEQLLAAVEEALKDINIDERCAQVILSSETEKSLLQAIYGKPGEWHEEDSSWAAGFDASYGWEKVMEQCFVAMAPYLVFGCKLTVENDDGTWSETTQGDSVVYQEFIS